MKLYGLIGRKLGHSFSADFFNALFSSKGCDARYELFELPDIADFKGLIDRYPNLEGLNVTVPYKESVIPFLDSLSNEAGEIGAVNLIKLSRHNGSLRLTGYNTDAPAFLAMTAPLIAGFERRKALVLGTGGAAKAVRWALESLGIKCTNVSRSAKAGTIRYGELTPAIVADAGIVVNATPAGMWPETETAPPFPYQMLSESHICIDVIYNPSVTSFMTKAAEKGATVKNGLEMLLGQARLGAGIWGMA